MALYKYWEKQMISVYKRALSRIVMNIRLPKLISVGIK